MSLLKSFDQARKDPSAKGRRFGVQARGQILQGAHGDGISPNEMKALSAAAAMRAPAANTTLTSKTTLG